MRLDCILHPSVFKMYYSCECLLEFNQHKSMYVQRFDPMESFSNTHPNIYDRYTHKHRDTCTLCILTVSAHTTHMPTHGTAYLERDLNRLERLCRGGEGVLCLLWCRGFACCLEENEEALVLVLESHLWQNQKGKTGRGEWWGDTVSQQHTLKNCTIRH